MCLISPIDTLNIEGSYNTGNESVLNMNNNKHMRKMIDIYSKLVAKTIKLRLLTSLVLVKFRM